MTYRDPYRHYRRRMRRGYGSRHGRYPVILPVDYGYQPLGIIALAAIGRAAYRHRSAFRPFLIAAGDFIAAAVLHQDHPGAWAAVAAVTAAAGVFLGLPRRLLWNTTGRRIRAGVITRAWEACGIDRAVERAYAGTVIAAAGGWLAAAIAIGPAVRPLPATAVIATVILAVPWWFHRRRREKVRVERIISGWPDVADAIGLPGSRIASVVVDAWGWTARVILKKGTTTAQAIARIPDIESGLELRPGSVRVIPDGKKANHLVMRVVETEPLAAPVPWPGPVIRSVTQLADIGISEDGRPVRVLLLRRNVLIGGIAGSGKSGVLNVIIAILAAGLNRWEQLG